MTHAYDEQYLDDAMGNLGDMLDYVVNTCYLDIDDFFDMFIASGLAAQFGNGIPKVVSGLSGIELAMEVMQRSGLKTTFPEATNDFSKSPEYWCGWILAYYQWYTGVGFKEITQIIALREVRKLYPTLHEASELKFVDTVNAIARRKKLPTKLKTLRTSCGYTQKELADKTGVSYRSIQQYESRSKDINKAAGATLASMAKVLGCQVEDLLEYSYGEVTEE